MPRNYLDFTSIVLLTINKPHFLLLYSSRRIWVDIVRRVVRGWTDLIRSISSPLRMGGLRRVALWIPHILAVLLAICDHPIASDDDSRDLTIPGVQEIVRGGIRISIDGWFRGEGMSMKVPNKSQALDLGRIAQINSHRLASGVFLTVWGPGCRSLYGQLHRISVGLSVDISPLFVTSFLVRKKGIVPSRLKGFLDARVLPDFFCGRSFVH